METFTKEAGRTGRKKERESAIFKTELDIKDNGRMILNMALANIGDWIRDFLTKEKFRIV